MKISIVILRTIRLLSIQLLVLICMLGFCFLCFEFFLRVTDQWNWRETYVAGDLEEKTRLFTPNQVVHHKMQSNGTTTFDATYTIDEFGRRKVPGSETGTRSKHLLLFGCSFLFGLGVEDDETIAQTLALHLPEHAPAVYAVLGGGMSNMLATLQTLPIEKQVSQQEGILLYFMFPEVHTARAMGFLKNQSVGWGNPYFQFAEDRRTLIYRGSFRDAWPKTETVIFNLLNRSRAAFWLAGVFRQRLEPEDYDLSREIVLQSRKEYLRRFPKGRFIVITMSADSALTKSLIDARAEVVILPQLPPDNKYRLPRDDHFSAEGNRLLAESILNALRPTL